MYAVVGCDDCSALWIVDGDPETTQCPRCGRTRGHDKRRKFVTTEDEDHAREVRSSMLATRQGYGDAFAELDSFDELEDRLEDSGVDDETYLAESGLDVDAIQEADADTSETQSRDEIVREAVETLDRPSAEEVVAYASDRGVPESYTERALTKLVRAGEASESRGEYRLL
ncbi:DUF5817 domain-containing protein [Halovenus salina]|uniref:DUF5817 domain-containing protein n=1 Tax=Halovenus salina TaxID=1510225 RepID=UPI002260A21B|nr:DUF5817 domain-containing protein [Halovenus salina]